ncbi:MAG: PAS domain S-box protein, partial [Nocardioidaceae bacterium]
MPQQREDGPPVGPQIVFGLDEIGRCTLSTGVGLAALGVKPGELVGQNLYDVYRDVPGAVEALDRVLGGETFSVEREFEGRQLAVYYEALRDPAGAVTGAIGVATDVTDQRRVEEEVRAARAREHMLGDLSVTLTREGLDPRALLLVAVRAVTEAVGDVGLLWLVGADGQQLEPRASCRMDPDSDATPVTWLIDPDGRQVPLDCSEEEALHSPRVVDLGGAGPTPDELATDGKATYLRIPLRSRGVLLGVIDVGRRDEREPFTDTDLELVADIAERCALSLDNALLLDANGKALEQLIKLEALAEASDNLIGLTDTNGRIVYSNPRVRSFGIRLTPEGDAWEVAARHLGEATSAEIRAALDRAGRGTGDRRFAVEGGEMFGHLAVFQLVHPATGAPLGTGWIAEDTTGLRSIEAALRTANADMKQFKALVEASPDFIAIAGLDGTVRYLNPGGRTLIGLDPDIDVRTTTIADYLTPEGLEASVAVEQPAVIAQGHWEGESTLRSRHGPAIPVAISSFLMHDAETGEPFALATVQRDITEQRSAEARLRDLAEQRQTLLDRLVEAQDEERIRIAADVHDDPVQVLSAVDLRLGMLRRRLRERAPELLEVLEPLEASVSGATDRLRALLFDLEPPDLLRGLTGALTRAAEEIFADSGTAWTIHGEREPAVPDAVRAIAY